MPARIATSQLFQRAQDNVANARQKELVSAEKAATGRELVRPSQNPSGFIIANSTRDQLLARETMAKNASMATKTLTVTENILAQLQDVTQRAYELAVAASGSGVTSAEQRQFAKGELDTLYESVIQTLNTRYGSRTLLAGYRADGPAFDFQGNFLGDDGIIEIEVAPETKVAVNIQAQRAIMGEGDENGINIIEVFQRLMKGLALNNDNMIHGTLEDFAHANDQLSQFRGEIGAQMGQIYRSLDSHEAIKVESLDTISRVEDADAIKVFSDLARDQAVLQAAISTSKSLLSETGLEKLYK